MKKKDSSNVILFGLIGLAGGIIFAPVLAAAVGGVGLLGAATTGTTIATLSGAALTSASLYAIGGSVFMGTVVISGLSATAAASVASYCNALENKNIEQARNELVSFEQRNRKEMESVFNQHRSMMSAEERKLWESVLYEA